MGEMADWHRDQADIHAAEFDDDTYTLTIKYETERAWLVADGKREAWLPKSQCTMRDEHTDADFNRVADFDVPDWLALEAGFA